MGDHLIRKSSDFQPSLYKFIVCTFLGLIHIFIDGKVQITTLHIYIYIYIYIKNQNLEKIQLDFNWILNFMSCVSLNF